MSFGVNSVEGERRFAGAGDSGDDGQLFVRDGQRKILEVVNARATDGDVIIHWGTFIHWDSGKGLLILV
jgi:hypothetical protein